MSVDWVRILKEMFVPSFNLLYCISDRENLWKGSQVNDAVASNITRT
jgi:hypothetical protein